MRRLRRGHRLLNTLLFTAALSTSARLQLAVPPLGISFSPAGLLTPFHLGVASRLRELGLVTQEVAFAGSSGGAIAAAVTSLGLPSDQTLAACNRVAQRCRDEGTYRTLSTALIAELDAMMPFEAHQTLNSRAGRTIIGYKQVFPRLESKFVSSFSSKEDVCEVITASCTIPFYFSGSLASTVRQGLGLDGYFSIPSRFGCPPTGAKLEIVVTPFRPELIRSLAAGNSIVDVISPQLLLTSGQTSRWRYSTSELFRLALAPPLPPSDDAAAATTTVTAAAATDSQIRAQYEQLFDAGSACADVWCGARGGLGDLRNRTNREVAEELLSTV